MVGAWPTEMLGAKQRCETTTNGPRSALARPLAGEAREGARDALSAGVRSVLRERRTQMTGVFDRIGEWHSLEGGPGTQMLSKPECFCAHGAHGRSSVESRWNQASCRCPKPLNDLRESDLIHTRAKRV